MQKWKLYIECGIKMQQLFYQNVMLLSGNPIYNKSELTKAIPSFVKDINDMLLQVLPNKEYVIESFGYSDASLDECLHNYEKALDFVSSNFSSPYRIRKKYLFQLGNDILSFQFNSKLSDGKIENGEIYEKIKTDLIGAKIPVEYVSCLNDENLSIFADRIIGYVESMDEEQEAEQEIKDLITKSLSSNNTAQTKLLEMLEAVSTEKNKKKKMQKFNEFVSALANVVTIASPFASQIIDAINLFRDSIK